MKALSNVERSAMRIRLVAVALILFLVVPSLPRYVIAQPGPPCPDTNLTECTRYKTLVADMDSGDLPTQLATLKAASQDLDPSLRSLIYGKALKSSDLKLRTAGIRYVLSGRRSVTVDLELPAHPTPDQQNLYKRIPAIHFGGVRVDENSDEITAVTGAGGVRGNIIRGGFEMTLSPSCDLRMSGGEEDVLRGVLRCHEGQGGLVELPATISLS